MRSHRKKGGWVSFPRVGPGSGGQSKWWVTQEAEGMSPVRQAEFEDLKASLLFAVTSGVRYQTVGRPLRAGRGMNWERGFLDLCLEKGLEQPWEDGQRRKGLGMGG